MKVLILGVTGMLGNAVFRVLSNNESLDVWGTLRSANAIKYYPENTRDRLLTGIDVIDQDLLVSALEKVKPDVVINCIGLIKQLEVANDPLSVLPVNAMLPHRLSRLCKLIGARFIHISTDCVFSGSKGMYTESDLSDANDLYGQSKFIGEVRESNNAITLRTSIIGHELSSQYALVEWFLSQQDKVKGYNKAIFSGLPTVELARVIRDYVLPVPELFGLYHVSADPIDKYSLIKLVAEIYSKQIDIIPDESVKIDRSLDSRKFRKLTGYVPPSWHELINLMHEQR